MTTDRRLEQLLGDVLVDGAPSHAPEGLRHHILFTTSRARPRSRWLADIKERPMRLHDKVAAGSPAMRLAYVVILTLILAMVATGSVVGAASLLPGPATIVVTQDGSGDFITISEAVAAARDGDTVLVKPGTYAEHVVIDRDITLEGDPGSPRDAIVIEYTLESPEVVSYYDVSLPNAITLDTADVTLRHLTIRGPNYGIGVQVTGGEVLIEDLGATMAGEFEGKGRYALHLTNHAGGVLRHITCNCSIGINGGAKPSLDDFQLTQDALIIDGSGTDPVVGHSQLAAVVVQDGATASLTANTVSGTIAVNAAGAAIISGNTIDGSNNSEFAGVTIDASSPMLSGNTIRGQVIGVEVLSGAAPTIEGNALEDNGTGIAVRGTSDLIANALVIQGNTFCGNRTDLDVPDGSPLTLDGNTVCEVAPSSEP